MTRRKIDRKDKKCHREFVWLAPSEYEHLAALMGKARLEELIDELNLYIGSKGDPYVSHYYTIQTWYRRSAKKAVSTVIPTSTLSAADANILVNALRRHRAMPADLPEPIAARFRRMYARMKGGGLGPTPTWPTLHHLLVTGLITEEQLRWEFLATE